MRFYGSILGLIFSLFLYLRFVETSILNTIIVYLLVVVLIIEFSLNSIIIKMKKWMLITCKMIIAYVVGVSFCFLLLNTSTLRDKIALILIVCTIPSVLISIFIQRRIGEGSGSNLEEKQGSGSNLE